jgi:L-lactate dehydrogenase complex protein LldG
VAAVGVDPTLERFLARAEKLGAKIHRTSSSAEEVARAVAEAVRAEGASSAMVADDFGAGRDDVVRALEAAGVAVVPGATPEAADPVEAGVTRAAFAVAETGSIGVVGNALQPRLATMLPPVHVALVDRAVLFPSLDDAGAELERLMTPGPDGVRYASLVTGPSRTADVEKTLAVGVHGPRVVHLVLVERFPALAGAG